MFDVPTKLETALAECDILTKDTLVYSLTSSNLSELTPITVIHELFAYFFIELLLLEHVLLLFNLPDNIGCLLISTKRALNYIIIFHLMLSPLTETFQMKCVSTNSCTGGCRIIFDNLHVTDGTQIIFILILLLNDHISSVDFYLGVF